MFTFGSSSELSPARYKLLELLNDGGDVELTFTAADQTIESVSAHSFILKRWSTVLAEALDIASSSSTNKVKIPMHSSNKEDWLLAMEQIYPVTPPVDISWASAESLLRAADKYGMTALLQRTAKFFKQNMQQLDYTPSSKQFIWTWIVKFDSFGLGDVAELCISKHACKEVHRLVTICPLTQLRQLSSSTLASLVTTISTQLPKSGSLWCSVCKAFTYERHQQGMSFNVCCGVCGSGVAAHSKPK